MNLSARVKALRSSTIMDISHHAQELKLKGHDVISLAAGEPDFNTPEPIQKAAMKALVDGITRYAPAQGFLILREAIAHMVAKENHFEIKPDEVVITSGAKHAIFLALQCLVDPGDTVLVPTPAWVSYGPMLELCGAHLVPLPVFEDDGYRINVDRWKALAVSKNAKGIIINSPNNPTGVVYSKQDLLKFAAWALQRNLWILSDEIYEKILYDGASHTSLASLGPEVKEATITVSGFSKSYAMTGWRLGWAIGNRDLIQKMTALQSQSNSHVTSFVQWAGVTAAKLSPETVATMVDEFDKRRHYAIERLERLTNHLSYVKPTGAFFIFANIASLLADKKLTDIEFCTGFLSRHHVALVPGSAFGKEKALRLSYATSLPNLTKAFDRLEKYLRN